MALIGPNAHGIRGDVSKLYELDLIYEMIEVKKGRLDVLFANAGSGNLAPLGQIAEEQVDATFDTNARGLLFTVQKALPLMANRRSIILNASTVASMGMPAFSV